MRGSLKDILKVALAAFVALIERVDVAQHSIGAQQT